MEEESRNPEVTGIMPALRHSRLRHAIAIVYVCIVACDFIVFPVAWTLVQVLKGITPIVPWTPLTLQGGGMLHLAMGAILGVQMWRIGQNT